jgi:general secretion pathway protein D
MSIKRLWNAIIVIGFMVLTGGLSSATWTPQEPSQPLSPAEERKRMLDRLSKQRQDIQQGARPPSNPSATPPVSAPSAPVPPAADAVQREGGKVQINYENADLYDFISEISSMLGLTPLIVDSEVKGSVNIISTGPMAKADVLPLFNLILKNNNAALVKQGDVYQIVPISSALKKGVEVIELPTSTPDNPPDSQKAPATPSGPVQPAIQKTPAAAAQGKEPSKAPKLATHVIRVEFVPVKDLIEPVKLFMTEGGVIMPYERLNMLIITDYTDNAARVLDIIRMLDNSYLDPNLVELIKIKNNASADVAEDLKKIFGSGTKDSATGISFVSLDRLNAIFVVAGSNRGLEEMRHWIAELDAESGRNFQTYVYVVENSTASNIAMMLSAFYGGEETTSYDSNAAGSANTGVTGGTRGAQAGSFGNSGSNRGGTSQSRTSSSMANQSYNQGDQFYNSGQNGGGFMNGGPFSSTQRLGPQLNPSRSITSQILRGGEFTGLKDTVRLVVDDVNNSLIIQATSVDYAYILETIKKMDVLPRQARIDAQIFEVELNDTLRFGVNAWLQARGETANGPALTTGSLVSGLLSAHTFAFVGDSRQIMVQIEALKNNTNVKILESPSILALDGTMASFNVGTEYPYSSGSYISSVGGSQSNVQYRETGVTLMVLPRISASGTVTMDITQEVSSAGASVQVGTEESAPTFPKAVVTNTFYVKDGETVAIAGLIRDTKSNGRRGIPFLSEIPILGSLFGVTENKSSRTELIVLITPHVIQTHEKLQEMSQELKDSLRNVRTLVDDTKKERAEDIQDAQKDRDKVEQELSKEEQKQKDKAQKKEEKKKSKYQK